MSAKKVLITGASGLLGRSLVRQFTASGWEVLGLAFSRATDPLRKVDIRDDAAIRAVLDEFSPSVVVHSAAERRPDVVEKNESETSLLNVESTTSIAKHAAITRTSMIYISTDYVFDGTKPPYAPTDEPNPLNKYGQSKRDGEKAAMLHHPNAIVLRVPILYGPVETLSESAVTVLLDAIRNASGSKPAVLSDYEKRYPTDVADIAVVCRQIADRCLTDPAFGGIFHWSGPDQMTKYEMGVVMAEVFGLSRDHIVANREPSKGAPRPYNGQLDTSSLEGLGIGQKTHFKNGIRDALKEYSPVKM